MSSTLNERICALNDSLRTTLQGGKVMLTASVHALCSKLAAQALAKMRSFDEWTPENDPHGEHDFGSFEIGGTKFFFKVDYYDGSMEYGPADPADPEKTTRVLTLMLAEDY